MANMNINEYVTSTKCLECGKVCKDETSLHKHFKAHRISQASYYTKHFPRYDKLDGSVLVFRNKEHYFTSDFNSRVNLRDWLDRANPDEAREYVKKLLLERKTRKKLVYTPCQVELRTLPMPGMVYMNRLFGNYYELGRELGMVSKFDKMKFDSFFLDFEPHHRIVIDTREQTPLYFKGLKTQTETLSFGDYKLNDDVFSDRLVIERKALSDFYTTLSGHYNRFEAEMYRAEAAGFYMVILVEASFNQVYDFSRYLRNRVNVVISPEYIFHNTRRLIQIHRNIQFLFVEDRDEAAEVAVRLFKCRGQFKHVDLQFLYDTGQLLS